MADQQQLSRLLLTSVRTWNTWRAENTDTHIDLIGANLSGADLIGANLSEADLIEANLSGANLREANLRGAILPGTNLSRANLIGANLSEADLSEANLSGADLFRADLSGADLIGANLPGADLIEANLPGANLSGADLPGADLIEANLPGANLSGADLFKASLSGANLSGANLSGATGILSGAEWIAEHFHTARDGSILVWTRKGDGTGFAAPAHWTIAAGQTITETVNPDRCTECACGVNFGTWAWCNAYYSGAPLWAACIEPLDLVDVVVPYNTDGKARCARLTLIKEVQS